MKKGEGAESIILLLEMLREKYSLSTHNSDSVKGWLRRNNKWATKQGSRPAIHVTLLSSKSQFLNVIVSVFGGMKKAVIHNSDYLSKKEIEIAMNCHFEERNIYFMKNPKQVARWPFYENVA